jgi:hypothetical protein
MEFTLSVRPWTQGGLTVRTALTLFALVAVMVAFVTDDTGAVVTAKLPVVWPAAIVMLAGTVAAAELLPRFTRTPPAGAGALRVTVPVLGEPPVTLVGESERLPMLPGPGAGGLIVRFAFTELALVALMDAVVCDATAVVFTVKLPVVWPAAMMMLAGTVADAELLASVTETPPAGAGALRVTVAVLLLPPVTVVGDKERLPMLP